MLPRTRSHLRVSLGVCPHSGLIARKLRAIHTSERCSSASSSPIPIKTPLEFFLEESGLLVSESPFYKRHEPLSEREGSRREIFRLVDAHNYSTLLRFLLRLSQDVQRTRVNSKSASPEPHTKMLALRHILSEDEIAFILNKIVLYQASLIKLSSTRALLQKTVEGVSQSSRMLDRIQAQFINGAYALTPKIRSLYSALLFSDPTVDIYARDVRHNIYGQSSWSGYTLTIQDYENLIQLETINNKLDLASHWFKVLDAQYQSCPHHMTPALWQLRFEVFCGGHPRSWIIPNTDLANTLFNPRRSKFASERLFLSVYSEFQADSSAMETGDVAATMTPTIMYLLGYASHISAITKLIEYTWGIGVDGTLTNAAISNSDQNYASYELVRSILAAFSLNNQFFEGMRYVKAFQEHYPDTTSLNTPGACQLWTDIFKWCNHATKIDQDRALQFFISQLKKGRMASSVSLHEAKQDVNFDYEGYLVFLKGVKRTRSQALDELWQQYVASGSTWSATVCKIYLDFITEDPDAENVEDKYYSMLQYLRCTYASSTVGERSYNRLGGTKGFQPVPRIAENIRQVYQATLEAFVVYKWKMVLAGQCRPLIEKWSLDEEMETKTAHWFMNTQLPLYTKMVETKRIAYLAELNAQDEELLLELL